jgi:hypothetical protein
MKFFLSLIALLLVIALLAGVNASYNIADATNNKANVQQSVKVNPNSTGCKVIGSSACDTINTASNETQSITLQVKNIVSDIVNK